MLTKGTVGLPTCTWHMPAHVQELLAPDEAASACTSTVAPWDAVSFLPLPGRWADDCFSADAFSEVRGPAEGAEVLLLGALSGVRKPAAAAAAGALSPGILSGVWKPAAAAAAEALSPGGLSEVRDPAGAEVAGGFPALLPAGLGRPAAEAGRAALPSGLRHLLLLPSLCTPQMAQCQVCATGSAVHHAEYRKQFVTP